MIIKNSTAELLELEKTAYQIKATALRDYMIDKENQSGLNGRNSLVFASALNEIHELQRDLEDASKQCSWLRFHPVVD